MFVQYAVSVWWNPWLSRSSDLPPRNSGDGGRWIGDHRLAVTCLLILGFVLASGSGVLFPGSRAAVTSRSVAQSNNMQRWNLPAETLSVGTAYAADARGLQGGLTNPASLSRISTNQFVLEYQSWGESWDLFSGGVAVPWYGGHALALQASWLDYGELEPRDPNELFRPQGNEFEGGLTYSYRVHSAAALGVSAKVYTVELDFQDRKTELAGTMGVLVNPFHNLWMGALVKNLGSSVKFGDTEDKLPNEYRAGVAWYVLQERVGFTVDGVFRDPNGLDRDGEKQDEEIGAAGGLRLLLWDHFQLSGGYHAVNENRDGPTAGLEIDYPNLSGHITYVDTGRDTLFRLGGSARF